MPLVSIVIPAYNAESTIRNVLSDVLAQTFRDYEVVIVDDGSTDSTSIICDKYADSNRQIQVIHQKNSGLSGARNVGTKNAKGKYVTYIDSDDRVDKHYLELLINALRLENADIACGRVDRIRDNNIQANAFADISKNIAIEAFSRKEAMKEMLAGRKLSVGACCRLIPRDWMIDNPFLEGKYYEDLSNTYRINLQANKIVLVDAYLYHYVMNGGSITGRKEPSVKQCIDYYEAVNICANDVISVYPDLSDTAAVLIARDYMSLYLHIRRCKQSDSQLDIIGKAIKEWMVKHWKQAAKNSMAPLNVRLRVLLFAISPLLYEKMYYIGIHFTGKKIG